MITLSTNRFDYRKQGNGIGFFTIEKIPFCDLFNDTFYVSEVRREFYLKSEKNGDSIPMMYDGVNKYQEYVYRPLLPMGFSMVIMNSQKEEDDNILDYDKRSAVRRIPIIVPRTS